MDLPPPPPPFFPHQNHRYVGSRHFIHPTDLVSPSFPRHHLSPPPLPPFPPSPPRNYMHDFDEFRKPYYGREALPSSSLRENLSHNFAFSPPHHLIAETTPSYDFDEFPEPYRGYDALPASYLRENLSLRLNYDYSERNPILEDDTYHRRYSDSLVDSLPENLHLDAGEFSTEISDVGDRRRYGDMPYCGRKLYNKWDDDDRRWENGDQAREFCNRRDVADMICDNGFNSRGCKLYDERRDYGMNARDCESYNVRDSDARSQDHGLSDRVCKLYSESDDDRKSQAYRANDRSCESYNVRDSDARSRGHGLSDRVCKLYSERDDGRKIQAYRANGRSCELYNERDGLGLGRFAGRLGRRVSDEELNTDRKKRRVQKMKELEIEPGTHCRRRSKGHYHLQASRESSYGISVGKEKVSCKRLETRMKDNNESDQSPIELDISFKSNALVAKAILPPCTQAVKSDVNLMHRDMDIGEMDRIRSSPSTKSCEKLIETEIMACGMDTLNNMHGVSEELLGKSTVFRNLSLTSDDSNDFGEKAAEKGTLENICRSPSAKSSENIAGTEILKPGLDIQSGRRGISEDPLEKSAVFRNRNMTTDDANDQGENAAANENLEDMKSPGSNNVGSGRTRLIRLREKKRVETKICLQTTSDSGKGNEDNNAPSAAPQLSITSLSEMDVNAAENGTLEVMKSLGSNNVGSGQTLVPRLRRKNSEKQSKISLSTNIGGMINSDNNVTSAVPQLNVDTSCSRIDKIPNSALLPSTVGIVSKKADADGHSDKARVLHATYVVPHMSRLKVGMIPDSALLPSSRCAVSRQADCDSDSDKAHILNVSTSAVTQLDVDKSGMEIGKIFHTGLLPSSTCAVFKKVDGDVDSKKARVPNSKRKRSSLTTLHTPLNVAESMISEIPLHTERLVISTKVADLRCQLVNDEVAAYANETLSPDVNILVSLGFCRHALKVGEYFLLDLGRSTSESSNQFPSSSRPKKIKKPDIHEDEYLSVHESRSASKAISSLLEKPENIAIPDVGVSQGGENSAEMIIVDGSADRSNCSLRTKANSKLLFIDEGINSEVNVSFLDIMSKSCDDGSNLSHKSGFIEESQEAIKNSETFPSANHPAGILGKRIDRDVQNNNEHPNSVRSIDCELANVSAKEPTSNAEVDFPCGSNCLKKVNSFSEEPSVIQDLSFDVADGSSSGIKKKRKVVSSILTPSLSENDSDAAALTSDCSELDPGSPGFHEQVTGQRKDTNSPASTATKKYGSNDMEVKVGGSNISVSDIDKTLASGNLYVKDDAALIQNLSFCSDGELKAPNSELSCCPSSSKDLLPFSDFSSLINPEASPSYPRNGMICETDRRPVSAYPSALSLGKSLEKATSENAQSNAMMPPVVRQGASNNIVNKSNLTFGKSTSSKNQLTSAVPKVLNTSKKLPPTHLIKSRTWHRSGNTSAVTAASKLLSCSLPQNHTLKMSSIAKNSSVAVIAPKQQPCHLPQSRTTAMSGTIQSSYYRKGNSLVREPSPSKTTSPVCASVYRESPCIEGLKKSLASNIEVHSLQRIPLVNASKKSTSLPLRNHTGKSSNSATCNVIESSPVANYSRHGSHKSLDNLDETAKSFATPDCQNGSGGNPESHRTLDKGNSQKKIEYIKRRSNQLVACSEDTSMEGVDKTPASLCDSYYKSRKNQLVRAAVENHATKGDVIVGVNSSRLATQALPSKSSLKQWLGKGFPKTYRSSKSASVWKLHDAQSSDKRYNIERHQKVWSRLVPWKRSGYGRSYMFVLGLKPNNNSLSAISQKLLLSRKRGAVYTRSTRGYSLRISKVLGVGGSSLKWSKSIEKNSKKANEDATRAVAAAEKRKKEEKFAVPVVSKSRNNVSRERVFRVGSERYKMDHTRRTLHRITAEENPSSLTVLQSEDNVKRFYVPRRLFIGNNEYVRIGNGNKLVRDPKKWTRILASERVRWSLRTARSRLVRKKKYCQFFTKFGKCNKDDGKCPYIHDISKVLVCTKFLNGSCTNTDCKLTHKVIPERMQDCSYFLKGSCSNENCPYRHVNVNPDSSVCESFLRGYCADGNECQKKHTYVCPVFEVTGICQQASTCKLHHPKKKENKPTSDQKVARGRYFDGALISVAADCNMATSEKLFAKGKDEIVHLQEGKYSDYISLDVSDDEKISRLY